MPQAQAIPTREAAEYVGCTSVGQFTREVKAGIWPKPIAPHSRPKRWSVPELDARLKKTPEVRKDDSLAELDRKLGITA